MRQWPQTVQASTWPPRAAVRQCSIADMILSWCRLRCPACAVRYAGPAARKISATSSEARTALAVRRLFVRRGQRKPVERTDDRPNGLRCDLRVEGGGV